MEVAIEGKSVVIIDDVLYTGRSIRAALTALDNYGRPKDIQLLVLIDRRFSRDLPIQPDYTVRHKSTLLKETRLGFNGKNYQKKIPFSLKINKIWNS